MSQPFHNPLDQAPVLYVLLSLSAGIGMSALPIVCRYMTADAWSVMAGLAAVGLACVWMYCQKAGRKTHEGDAVAWMKCCRRQKRILHVAALAVLFFAGGAYGAWRAESLRVSWPSVRTEWTAQVIGVNRVDSADVQADVRLSEGRYEGKNVRLKVYGGAGLGMQEGDVLHFTGRIRQPYDTGNPYAFDYRTYLLHKGISGTAWCESDRCRMASYDGTYVSLFLDVKIRMLRLRREVLSDYGPYFDGRVLQVLSALTLGDRTALDSNTRQVFSDTGASHVLALSGLHLGILFSLFQFFVLRWCRRRPVRMFAACMGLAGLWLFVMLCGGGSSLVRSAGMLTVMLLLRQAGRPVPTLQSLALAALAMLLADPFTLFDVGFQLSFAAVFSILFFGPWMQQVLGRREEDRYWMGHPPLRCNYLTTWVWIRHRAVHAFRVKSFQLGRALLGLLLVSLAAQIGTVPLVVYYFHSFSPYALLSGFWVIPLVWLILVCAVLFVLVPVFRPWTAFILQPLLQSMLKGLEFLAALPAASCRVYADGWWLAAFVAACVVCAYGFIGHRRKFRWAGYAALGICLATHLYKVRPGRVCPAVWVYSVPRGTAVHFISSDERSYLLTSFAPDTAFAALHQVEKDYWQRLRMARPVILRASFRNDEISCTPHAVAFGPLTVGWADGITHAPQGIHPLVVDLLVVGSSTHLPASELLRMFHPRQVVLDASLHEWKRDQYLQDFQIRGIEVHGSPWHLDLRQP